MTTARPHHHLTPLPSSSSPLPPSLSLPVTSVHLLHHLLHHLLLVPLLLLMAQTSPSPEVTSASYYHSDLVLDFLCASRSLPAFVRDVPWDCGSYMVCLRGRAFHGQCPPGRLYSGRGRGRKCLVEPQVNASRCRGQLFEHIDAICRVNPTARIPSPDSCGQYVDCQARQKTTGPGETSPAGYTDGLLECSYPLLFSPATGRCEQHGYVHCRHKFEPKAPCDYLQYLQLYHCDSSSCPECERHHPSCVSLVDGLHPVPGRSDVMMKCQDERTVDFVTCPPGFSFPVPMSGGKGQRSSAGCVRS